MAEKTFKLKWKDCLGRDWMNKYNLEACLFSKEHIKVGGLTVEEVGKNKMFKADLVGEFKGLRVYMPPKKMSWWRKILRIGG